MPTKHFAVIVNPRGGTGRGPAVVEAIQPLFAAADSDLRVFVTEAPGHATEIARTADLDGCAGLCVVGGDGTIHEVINGFLRRDPPAVTPLGFIPGGTGNSLLLTLGVTDPETAVAHILANRTRPLDVARVSLRDAVVYCVNIVGWGIAVDINSTAETLRWLGPPRYTLSTVWHVLLARHRRIRLVLDGEVIEDEFQLVVGCNTAFTGKGMRLAPRADLADGRIDVVTVRHATRRQLLRIFRCVFGGTHLACDGVECRQVRSFAIEDREGGPLNLDGELKGSTPVAVDVLGGALQVFASTSVPGGDIRAEANSRALTSAMSPRAKL